MVAAGRGSDALRIVYFGTPEFAVPTLTRLLASRHAVCGVVTQPDRPRGRGQKVSDSPIKRVALEHGVPVFQPQRLRDEGVLDIIGGWRPDLGVVAAYGKLLPETLLHLPPHGMINVHASLLPAYRGAAPVHRAVIDGASETGVTIIRLVKALDAGNMLATVSRPIGPDETSDVVERDLAEMGATLLLDVVEQIVSGTVQEERQDDSAATYAARLTKEEGLIDWTLPAPSIHNRVRGLYPWPHAYSHLEGARVIVLKTRVQPETGGGAQPGTVIAVRRDAIDVATGRDGRLAIEHVQPEGRRPMSVRDFLASRPLHPGARFGSP
jgi:methionyl-tRNA formyltransferase